MLVAGLTGGIGTGKSTFAVLLAERGAHVIDADELGRDALKPGEPAWAAAVGQFGDEILVAGSMDIDRKRLADIVFDDRAARVALNEIVHPVILSGIADALEALADSDAIVVIDAALIVDLGLDSSLDVLIVVTADKQLRAARVAAHRGMSDAEFAARVAAQVDEGDLIAKADIVVKNNGDLGTLAKEADRVWNELVGIRSRGRGT